MNLPRHDLVEVDRNDFTVRFALDAGDAGDLPFGLVHRLGLNARNLAGFAVAGSMILGNVKPSEAADASTDDQQQGRRDGRRLQAGGIVAQLLQQAFKPARGRQRVQCFFKANAGTGNQVCRRFFNRVSVGQQLQRPHLFAFLGARRAGDQMPFEFVCRVVGQLAVIGHDDALVCQFAVHVKRPSSLKKCFDTCITSAGPPIAISISWSL